MAGYPLVDGQVHLVTVLYVHHFRGHTRRPHDGEGLRYFGTACRHLAYRTLLLVWFLLLHYPVSFSVTSRRNHQKAQKQISALAKAINSLLPVFSVNFQHLIIVKPACCLLDISVTVLVCCLCVSFWMCLSVCSHVNKFVISIIVQLMKDNPHTSLHPDDVSSARMQMLTRSVFKKDERRRI